MRKFLTLLFVLALLLASMGAQAISASVAMKVSRNAQDSVVNVGEDLLIDVAVDGIIPESYAWYFEGAPIQGAASRALQLYSVTPEDAGLYRVDAFDASGKMVVSIEFTVRVVEEALPQSGDGTLALGSAAGLGSLLAAGLGTVCAVRKRRVRVA